ncbi:phosphopantetheine-binding protein [Paenibacillus sp. strain BS8-2]
MQDKFERCRLEQESLRDELRLSEDLLIDSIMIVQLIVYIELDLGLSVPDAEVDPRAFATVGSLLSFMEELEPVDADSSDQAIGGASLDEAVTNSR